MMHTQSTTIADLLITYLNIIGIALVSSLIICWGLSIIFPQKKLFNRKLIFGLSIVLIGVLLLIRKIPGIIE